MSAFIVSDQHINALLTYHARSQFGGTSHLWDGESWLEINVYSPQGKQNLTKFGQILVDQNYRSVNHRYESTDSPHRYKFVQDQNPLHLRPVQILKLCQSFDYQACETDDYKTTIAAQIIDNIKNRAIGELAGYESAEWTIR